MTVYNVSVLLPEKDAAHPYATNPRLILEADSPNDLHAMVRERYPSGVVMGVWERKP